MTAPLDPCPLGSHVGCSPVHRKMSVRTWVCAGRLLQMKILGQTLSPFLNSPGTKKKPSNDTDASTFTTEQWHRVNGIGVFGIKWINSVGSEGFVRKSCVERWEEAHFSASILPKPQAESHTPRWALFLFSLAHFSSLDGLKWFPGTHIIKIHYLKMLL